MMGTSLPDNVGRYAIDRKIAEGGFGDVYRATDTELGRSVAIKAVRLEPGASSTLRERFRREAEVLARIDHPFICKVYEIVEFGDQTLLVMEFVEGKTLASLLKAGPLGLPRTLKLAGELSEALGFAHEAGVIHRDIKPANILITHNEHVKLVDFGIAKRAEPVTEDEATALTEGGILMGTVHYMSPEQATGSDVDGRTDVFSFGVILYQCLTGELPYDGKDRQEYFSNLLNDRREKLPDEIPRRVRDVVDQCLQPDPDDRIGSFDEIRRWLRDERRSGLERRRRGALERWPGWSVAAVAAVAVALIAFAVSWLRPSLPDTSFVGSVQAAFITSPYDERYPRLSPDGSTVVFVSDRGGGDRLWLAATESGDPEPITETALALKGPTWSSAGDEIAYLSRDGNETQLLRVTAFGAQSAPPFWLTEDYSVVDIVRWSGPRIYLVISDDLWSFDTTTDELSRVFESPMGELRAADVDPDGSRVVFSVNDGLQQDLWLADLENQRARPLTDSPFNERSPVFAGSGDTIVYLSNEGGQIDVWELDLSSNDRQPLTVSPQQENSVHVAANGTAFVAGVLHEESDLWVGYPDEGRSEQLTADSLRDYWPTGSSAAGSIVFHRSQPTRPQVLLDAQLMLTSLAGLRRDEQRRVVSSGYGARLSTDGRWLAFLRSDPETGPRPSVVVKDLERGAEHHVADRFEVPTWSPYPLFFYRSNMSWSETAPRLYYIRMDTAGAPVIESVEVRSDGTIAPSRVVHQGEPGWRLVDLTVARDDRSLAFIAIDETTAQQSLALLDVESGSVARIYVEEDADDLYLRGWRADGSVVVVRATQRPEAGDDCALVAIDSSGTAEDLVAMTGVRCPDIVVDIPRARAFFASIQDHIHNLGMTTFGADQQQRRLTDNTQPNVSFVAPLVLDDGTVLFARHERHNDVWLSRGDH